jgi:hypothetical protein
MKGAVSMIRRNLMHLLALVFFGLTASMWAQNAALTTDVQGDRKDLRKDRRDLRMTAKTSAQTSAT